MSRPRRRRDQTHRDGCPEFFRSAYRLVTAGYDQRYEENGGELIMSGRAEIVMVGYSNNITFVDTRFEYNRGQAIRAFQLFTGSFNIEGCDFVGNKMFEDPDGLVYVKEVPMTNVTISGSTFKNNSGIIAQGGALSLHVKDAWIDDCIFEQNAAKEGGAIYIKAASAFTVTGSTFSENVADYGGAITACAGSGHTCTGRYELTNIVGVRNQARLVERGSRSGGAFMKMSGADLLLRGVQLEENVAGGNSSISLRYTNAQLHNVRIDDPSSVALSQAGRMTIYCSPGLGADKFSYQTAGGGGLSARTAWDVTEDASECSYCLSGTEWTGSPTNSVRAGTFAARIFRRVAAAPRPRPRRRYSVGGGSRRRRGGHWDIPRRPVRATGTTLRTGGLYGLPFCQCVECATGDFKPAGGPEGGMCERCPDGQFSPVPGWAKCVT